MASKIGSTLSTLAGWIGTLLVAAVFCMSAAMKLSHNPKMVPMMAQLGWSEPMMTPLAVLELACVALYLLPTTAVLGAVVLTGYLGGAIATHVRVGQPVYIHVALGLLIWGGIYLREPRLRQILPKR